MKGDMASMTKFIMVVHRTEHSQVRLFAREDNGMIIGGAQDTQAQFGEEPKEIVQRAFIDHDAAVEWLKQKCREYAGRDDIDFLVRDGDRQIVVAPAGRRMV